MSAYPHLLSPASWGPVPVRNRVFMPPMGMHMVSPDGGFSEQEIAFQVRRAAGGAGLLTTGCMMSQETYEPPAEALVRASRDSYVPKMQELTEAVHAKGAKIAAQLTAAFGRNVEPHEGFVPFSASEVPLFFDPAIMCRALTVDEIHGIVELFGEACARCVSAGFDGIDIHAHTGYLPDQFMSAEWNHRTDEYGGSLENRLRFPVELVKVAREAIGDAHAISFRLTVDQMIPGGRTVDEARQMAPILAAAGIDVLSLDVGSYDAMQWICPSYYAGDNPNLDLFAAVAETVDVQVAVSGNVTPAVAEREIAKGTYQFMGSGRALIADPDWPTKLAEGREADVRPCIRCNEMCMGNVMRMEAVTCAVNPEAGRELVDVVAPTSEPKHLVVVGAGPAGLETARLAGVRGHTVDVYERGERIGGVLEPAARAQFKSELHKVIDWYEHQLAALPDVTVHLGTEVKAGSSELEGADTIVVATGARARTPAIPGLDLPHVLDVLDFHLSGSPAGDRVVVCGGGLSGCDAALELAEHGTQVTVVEMLDAIAPNLTYQTRLMLLERLTQTGVRVLTKTRVTSVGTDGVHVDGPEGAEVLAADTVISAFGVASDAALATELTGHAPSGTDIRVIGDAARPAKVGDAIHAGFRLALTI